MNQGELRAGHPNADTVAVESPTGGYSTIIRVWLTAPPAEGQRMTFTDDWVMARDDTPIQKILEWSPLPPEGGTPE